MPPLFGVCEGQSSCELICNNTSAGGRTCPPPSPTYIPLRNNPNKQTQTMAKETPSRHAGLVTFNGEVSLIGDGSGDSRVVAGDRLSDGDALKEVGRAYPLSRPISEAKSRLADRLFALEEGGPTALGPAVVAGLSMLKVTSTRVHSAVGDECA